MVVLFIMYILTRRLPVNEPGAAFFVSVFLVKHRFISISPEQDAGHPVWRSSHLFADSIQIYAGVAFYDQFIMDMTNDETVPEGLHGAAER